MMGASKFCWIDDAELHAEAMPTEHQPYYCFDAVREEGGWRITTMIVPAVYPYAPAGVEFVDCLPGLFLRIAEGCADPTSTLVLWIATDGGLVLNSGAPFHDTFLAGVHYHPYGHGIGLQPLVGGAWIVTSIHHHPDNLVRVGTCAVGSLLYPGEECNQHGSGSLRVFRSGFAQVATAGAFERVRLDGYEVVYGGSRVAHYAFTAERQSDGGFLITAMRQVRPQHEAQVQRQRGDCFAGLILGVGDGCRYPSSRELLVVLPDGSVGFGGGPLLRYDVAFTFTEWGRTSLGVFFYRPLRDGRQILVRMGADTARSIGSCFVGLTVHPGRSCWAGSSQPTFSVFFDSAFYNGVAAHNDLEVDGDDGAPGLRAERQPDRTYIIRELG